MARGALAFVALAVALATGSPARTVESDEAFVAAATDEAFVAAATTAGMLEERLGRLVAEHGSSPGVRAFAHRMVEDHGAANDALAEVARREALALPLELAPTQQVRIDRLEALRGGELDRAYVELMVEEHAKDVAAFRRKAAPGETSVERFAARILPMLEAHLEDARRVAAELHLVTSR